MTATVDQQTSVSSVEAIQTWLVNQLSKQLSIPAKNVKIDEPLTRYGLDSIDSVTVVGDLEDWLGQELPSTLLWDYPTIEKAAQHLVNELGVSATGVAAAAAPAAEPEKASTGKGWGLWGRG
ncbi:MAG TPA: acyl carrier protein [Chroococcidiopsis sp.]